MRVAPTGRRFKGTLRQYHAKPVAPHPRTNQTTIRPTRADPIPIRRSEVSGVSRTLAMACFAASGKAAKINPSMTKTSPSAARKSDMPLAICYRVGAWPVDGALSRDLPEGSEK